MTEKQLQIRNKIRMMSSRRAIAYIKSFDLLEEEELLLIECDVHRKTYAKLHSEGYSDKVIKSARRRAYAKIVDDLYNNQEARG